MQIYIPRSILALLPLRARIRMGFGPDDPGVRRAALISGACELLVALALFAAHFYYFMTERVNRIVDAGGVGGIGNEQVQMGLGIAVYLEFVLLSPITWLLAYFMIEGTVRFTAALITGEVLSTLPLKLIDLGMMRFARYAEERKLPPLVEDEVFILSRNQYLIRSSREKDWDLATTVRINIHMYEVYEIENIGGPLPYQYRLRPTAQGKLIRKIRVYVVPPTAVRTDGQAQELSNERAAENVRPRTKV
jgi:hypothetical protein